MPQFGPLELIIILVIVAMLFGVGKLPEVFGAVGKGVREFRTNAQADTDEEPSKKNAEKVEVEEVHTTSSSNESEPAKTV